jgi:hypothetical protein
VTLGDRQAPSPRVTEEVAVVMAVQLEQLKGLPEAQTVSLGERLKPRPEKAMMRRVGIVPEEPAEAQVELLEPITADGFKFPANGGVTDTNVVCDGGPARPARCCGRQPDRRAVLLGHPAVRRRSAGLQGDHHRHCTGAACLVR